MGYDYISAEYTLYRSEDDSKLWLFESYLVSPPFEFDKKINQVYHKSINILRFILVDDIPAAVKTLRTNVFYLGRLLNWRQIGLLPS